MKMNVFTSIVVYLLLVAGMSSAILFMSFLIGWRPLTAEKDVPYECGMLPVEKADTFFSIQFYKIALLFVVFDIELVFLYLWAIVAENLGVMGLTGMFVFIGVLLAAFFYAWQRGDFKWE